MSVRERSSLSQKINLDFSLEERRKQGYVNTDVSADNSCFSEVLPIRYLVTDVLFLLSKTKSSRK